jgi:flavin reductase (DIM6/NTAB) family NADH-FMN oxidoreductase RutF
MKEEWIKTLGTMTYGIYALTTAHEVRINAMISSWVSQVSYDPPMIAIAVHPNRYTHKLIENSGAFAVHVLKKTQKNLVTRFMGSDPDKKLEGIDWQAGKTGSPILKDCAAWFECKLNDRIQAGNHTLFFGEVIDAMTVSDEAVLTTREYRGQYIGKV